MKKNLFSLFTLCLILNVKAQLPSELAPIAEHPVLTSTHKAIPFAELISAQNLEKHVFALASPEFEGRETGTIGQQKAADYIANHFKKLKLPPIGDHGSYFQKIAFTSETWNQIELTINGNRQRHLTDFLSFPSLNVHKDMISDRKVIFLGYGIEDKRYNDYKGINVKNKIILIYRDEPVNQDGVSWLTGSTTLSDWSQNFQKKLETAHRHGVALVLIIDPDIKKSVAEARSTLLSGEMKMGEGLRPQDHFANSAFISSTIAKEIVGPQYDQFIRLRDGIKQKGKPAHMTLPCELKMVQKKNVLQLVGSNVLGFVEGIDPALKHELIVVSAHYDHLGKRGTSVYFGADDNASGSATLLEIAHALQEARRQGTGPRRSVLCLLVSGEEKGLLGSAFYTEHPLFPLESTIANVNVDMVGRIDSKHEGNANYVYVIGADRLSTDLHDINEAANAIHTQLELDYTFNAKNDPNRFYYRSDHYNFAKKGIPAIFYFSGTHEDYHRVTDTPDKILFDKMEKIGRLIFFTIWELANRPERIRVNRQDKD